MNRTDSPKKQPVPFAVNGQRENLLNTTPAGDNTASYDAGFPAVTMILKAAGGLPPKGQDMNQILYELSLLARWSSAGALNTFDSAFAAGIGGYPKGSVLLSNTSSDVFISTVDANTSDPNSVTTGWLSLLNFLGGAPLNSPAFSGTPTVPTASATTNSTQAASTAFVHSASGGVVGDARNVAMTLSAASATATLTADEVLVSTALGGSVFRIGSFNKSVNLATTGAGGMDTGSAPVSGFVGLYAIFNPTTATSALLAVNATSAVLPEVYGGSNMPAGYTASALLSVVPTDSNGKIIALYQQGRNVLLTTTQIASTTSFINTPTAVSLSSIVPKNCKTIDGILFLTSGNSIRPSLRLQSLASADNGMKQIVSGTNSSYNSMQAPFSNLVVATPQTLYWSVTKGESGDTLASAYAYLTSYTF